MLHEGTGSQWHAKLEAPCGVDAVLVEWMLGHGVEAFHYHSRRKGLLYTISPARIKEAGVTEFSDDRFRYYVNIHDWAVTEAQKVPYRVPWITPEKTLDPRQFGLDAEGKPPDYVETQEVLKETRRVPHARRRGKAATDEDEKHVQPSLF